ncbi:MAG TPA: hypothetical protein ENN55_04245 [Firmicutes bacterium]|nr:hypothetical protein [Bacillota bacterium]
MKGRNGSYAGTEAGGKWYSSYTDENFGASFTGLFYADESIIYFKKENSERVLKIPLRSVRRIEKGKLHAGKWLFNSTIVKIVWEKNGMELSSGFVFSRREFETQLAMQEIKNAVEDAKKGFIA